MLKDSIKINTVSLNNRLVMPPMGTGKADPDGNVTDDLCEYYLKRTAGGYIGLLITEYSYISRQGKDGARQLSLASDENIAGLKKLTDLVRANGTKVFAQMNHAGSACNPKVTGCRVVGPSAVPHPTRKTGTVPEELTEEEIQKVEDSFAEAALRAKRAGFDGVELHSAHGYLLNQFYSPLTNKRTDQYGADSVENRVRMHVETLRKVRALVGPDYPVAVRLGGADYEPGGSTVEDAIEACVILEREGVDLLDLSGGMCSFQRPGHREPGYFKDMTLAIKKAVSVPVLLTGGVTSVTEAEELLREQCADLIGVGRALLKYADWAEHSFAHGWLAEGQTSKGE